jgi:hypothetical protein
MGLQSWHYMDLEYVEAGGYVRCAVCFKGGRTLRSGLKCSSLRDHEIYCNFYAVPLIRLFFVITHLRHRD